MDAVESWSDVGHRIREARLAAGLSQAELAARLGLDRSALSRVEAGARHLSALELYRLSSELDLPLDHFLSLPPPALVSRRQELMDDADTLARDRFRVDARLEAYARDAQWLRSKGFLVPEAAVLPDATLLSGHGASEEQARVAARQLRAALALSGPLDSLAEVCATAGLYILVIDGTDAGASLLLDEGFGVAVVGADAPPGRRRSTAAHELGHFVLQDEYQTDIGVAATRDEREQRIDAFASEFLLPDEELALRWPEFGSTSSRARLVAIAGQYRVSWSLAVRTAERLGLTGQAERAALRQTPSRGEIIAILGKEPVPDLASGETSGSWKKAVLAAFAAGAITARRAVELMHDVIAVTDLPDVPDADFS